MIEPNATKPLALWHVETNRFPGGRIEVRLGTLPSWSSLIYSLSEEFCMNDSTKWFEEGPSSLLDRAVELVNVSFLRRFHPHLTLLLNDPNLKEPLSSQGIEHLEIPIFFHVSEDDHWELMDDGKSSFFVSGETFDPLWLECVVGGAVLTMVGPTGIFITPIFLLSSHIVDIHKLGNLFDDVQDVDNYMDALLEVFDVVFLGEVGDAYSVMTKDPEVVSFLEKAPEKPDEWQFKKLE